MGLMDVFGVPHALSGDLLEERRAGRSAMWFWRQAAGAVVSTIAGETLRHPWRALRAVVLAEVLFMLLNRPTNLAAGALGVPAGNWLLQAEWSASRLWWIRLDAGLLIAGALAAAGIGAVVALLHPRAPAATVAVSAGALFLLTVPGLTRELAFLSGTPGGLFYAALHFVTYWSLLRPLAFMLGGLSVAARTARAAG